MSRKWQSLGWTPFLSDSEDTTPLYWPASQALPRVHYPDMIPACKLLTDVTRRGGGVGLQRDLGRQHWFGRSPEPWVLLAAVLPMSLWTLGNHSSFLSLSFPIYKIGIIKPDLPSSRDCNETRMRKYTWKSFVIFNYSTRVKYNDHCLVTEYLKPPIFVFFPKPFFLLPACPAFLPKSSLDFTSSCRKPSELTMLRVH